MTRKLLCLALAAGLMACKPGPRPADELPAGQYDGYIGNDALRGLASVSGLIGLVGDSGTLDFGEAWSEPGGTELELRTYRPTAARAQVIQALAAGDAYGWVEWLERGAYQGYVDSAGRQLDLDLYSVHPGVVQRELSGDYASADGFSWLWISSSGDVVGDDGLGCYIDGWFDAPQAGVAEGWLEFDCSSGRRWSGPALAGAQAYAQRTELQLIAADGTRAVALWLEAPR